MVICVWHHGFGKQGSLVLTVAGISNERWCVLDTPQALPWVFHHMSHLHGVSATGSFPLGSLLPDSFPPLAFWTTVFTLNPPSLLHVLTAATVTAPRDNLLGSPTWSHCLAFRVPSAAFEWRSNTWYYKRLPKEPGNPSWKCRDSSWAGGRQYVYFLPVPADSKEDIAYSWWEISCVWAADCVFQIRWLVRGFVSIHSSLASMSASPVSVEPPRNKATHETFLQVHLRKP